MPEIVIGEGLLSNPKLIDTCKKMGSRVAIITDSTLAPTHGNSLQQFLNAQIPTQLFSFPHGEQHKTRETKQKLEDQLLASGHGRDTCMIALGGGVVTDLVGFLAATYNRGVPLILIPTSLMGMVDAAIGGKNGVNAPAGKNLIGTIYDPAAVFIDLTFLSTLPAREMRNGLTEMLKHGLIYDKDYLQFLENNQNAILQHDPKIMERAIRRSIEIKKAIADLDKKEGGQRRLLNFGHTIGHAIETTSHYEIPHGEAVAIGMAVESHIARQLGYLDKASLEYVLKLIHNFKLIPENVKFSISELLAIMTMDKKSQKGIPRFVILNGIGSALACDGHYCMPVNEQILKQSLEWMCHDLCCH